MGKPRGRRRRFGLHLSLTLEAEYVEYRGQGKRATPEDMFKMRPFCLQAMKQSFSYFDTWLHLEKGENKGTQVNIRKLPPSLGFCVCAKHLASKNCESNFTSIMNNTTIQWCQLVASRLQGLVTGNRGSAAAKIPHKNTENQLRQDSGGREPSLSSMTTWAQSPFWLLKMTQDS